MTSSTSPLLRTVDEMLLDAGDTDPRLRATLLLLGALASLPVPEPRAELAALLSTEPSQLARHRLRRRHRSAAVGLAGIAGMGLGVAGVAATATAPTANVSGSIQHLLRDWAPAWTIAGVPAARGATGDVPGTPAVESNVHGTSAQSGQGTGGQGTADAGTTEQGTARPETDVPGSAAQDNGPGRSQAPGRKAAPPGNSAADGGASGNATGATHGGGASQGGRETREHGAASGSDPAGEPEKARKLVTGAPAAVDNLTSAILAPVTTDPARTDPVTTEKTGAGNAGPGSIWLKKFSR